MRPDRTTKVLRYTFTQAEIIEQGKKLAEANTKITQIENDQKRVVSDFKAKAAQVEAEI